jgi:hypothetical protein
VTNVSLPDAIKAVPKREAAKMIKRINKAVLDRATFEREKSPNGSHVELRRVANLYVDSDRIARFLVVLGADPDLMFNRVRKDGTRSNLKGLKKVSGLVDYVTGKTGAIETVTKALFAGTIIAALKGVTWVASQEQEFILSSEKVASMPLEIREAIYAYQHKHMTIEGDSRPQSCAFRTTFANIGVFHYMREDFDNTAYTMGVVINMDSPVVQYLVERWELAKYKD